MSQYAPSKVVVKFKHVSVHSSDTVPAEAVSQALSAVGLDLIPGSGTTTTGASTVAALGGSSPNLTVTTTAIITGVYAITDGSSVDNKVAQLQQIDGGWVDGGVVG